MNNQTNFNYKNCMFMAYSMIMSVFACHSVIFEQGLTLGFIAGVMPNISTIWMVAISFIVCLLKITSGEFVSYIILLSTLVFISFVYKNFAKNNTVIKCVAYAIIYIPALFLFKITPWYQACNYIICIIVACLSNQVTNKINSSKDFSIVFSTYYFNSFIFFIIGISTPTISFLNINLYELIFAFITLCYSKLTDEKTCILTLAFLAIAGYIAGVDYAFSILAICVLSSIFVREWNKIITACVYVISIIMLSFVQTSISFNVTTSIVSSLIGAILFMFVPHKRINELSAKNKYASQKEIINRDRDKISVKIDELSACFNQISDSYKSISKSKVKLTDGIEHTASETIKSLCEGCENYRKCQANSIQRKAEFEYLAKCATTKSKATMLDFGDFISTQCINKIALLNNINSQMLETKNQIIRLEEKSKQKEEVARTYTRVADVLKKLSKEASHKINFDSSAQMEISARLDTATIFYKELFIYQKENKCICVEMVARNEDITEIQSVLKHVFNNDFYIESISRDENSACDYIVFAESPKINLSYGYSTKPKRQGEPNGDSITIMNLPNGRHVFAICDGMGSGENANTFSQKAIDFIENLFKAGFSASDVISSVNGFMESCEYNSYATLDILEIDLYLQKGYLYKVGSPDTYYKSDKIYQISSKALPIGIMKELKIEINYLNMQYGNKIVLTSDGVLDNSRNQITSGLNAKNFGSPQEFATDIMQECDKKMKRGNSDDRSIIVIEVTN